MASSWRRFIVRFTVVSIQTVSLQTEVVSLQKEKNHVCLESESESEVMFTWSNVYLMSISTYTAFLVCLFVCFLFVMGKKSCTG